MGFRGQEFPDTLVPEEVSSEMTFACQRRSFSRYPIFLSLTWLPFNGSSTTTTTHYSFLHTGNNSQLTRQHDDSQLQDRQLARFPVNARSVFMRRKTSLRARCPVIRSTLNDEGLPFSRINPAHGRASTRVNPLRVASEMWDSR